jgi:hypothetical protein
LSLPKERLHHPLAVVRWPGLQRSLVAQSLANGSVAAPAGEVLLAALHSASTAATSQAGIKLLSPGLLGSAGRTPYEFKTIVRIQNRAGN